MFVVDSTAHDEQTVSTLKQLFDGVISIQEHDGGFRTRLLGVGDDNSWREL